MYYLRSYELTQCSTTENVSNFNLSSTQLSTPLISIESVANEIKQCCSLIVPTFEALQRAARLISTAAIMAADYRMNAMHRQYPNLAVSQLYKWTFQSSDSEYQEHESQYHELENAIARLEKDLERAQHEYVSSDRKSNGEEPILERTVSKRAQKETMLSIASDLADAQEALTLLHKNGGSANNVHQRNAVRLLNLCRTNGGVYVKVGQHLANLDLLLPEEYIQTLSSLFDDAPASTYSDVCEVVKEELGLPPEDLFNDFSTEPFASASLAQVHTAKCKTTGKKLAIKVQHKGLRDTSKGDLLAMATVVRVADKLFDEFNFGWICEELTPQLPKELDFINEGKNAEVAAAHLSKTGLDCVVPRVLWKFTNHRVLTMEFEEGFRATDVDRMEKAGIKRGDVAKLISSVFNSQIFQNGFVHCDPHEANVLLREHPRKSGKPQIVLVDHGLYKKLDADFREAYARLWKGILVADIEGIKTACKSLGVTKMYPLLAAMLTSRPFDEVIERSQTRSFDASQISGSDKSGGDKAVIRGYAQRYIKEIISMLDIVPR
eukprot:CCRYP_005504-RA/>CCRYP_005504-RA protein AED:0.02 eAED:0.02 QI:230/1/1/1/0.66/0.25/4/2664/549